MVLSAVERYLRLGLQLGRHVEGIVDAYYGPPELASAVEGEPPVDPRALVSTAELLLDELEDGWLRDQVVGLRTYAGVMAGESLSYADEAQGCYGVRATYTDEAVFTAAHERLAELLPGHEPLAERYARWQDSILVPPEQVESRLRLEIVGSSLRGRGAASGLPTARVGPLRNRSGGGPGARRGGKRRAELTESTVAFTASPFARQFLP